MKDHSPFVSSSLSSIQSIAAQTAFEEHEYGQAQDWPLRSYTKNAASPDRPWVYISSGVHGDEPAPVQSVIEMWQTGLFSEAFNWVLCPLVNPVGMARGTRENGDGIDLNRDYRHPSTAEVKFHTEWVNQNLPPEKFAIALNLHEDWEAKGPYLYSLSPTGSQTLARQVLEKMDTVLPLEAAAEIDGMPADKGLITPQDIEHYREERADWPETFFLWEHAKSCMTFESPSSRSMESRVAILRIGVETVLKAFS